MWTNLSYKQKVIFSGLGLLCLLLMGYYLSFGKTIALYQENNELNRLTGTSEQELIMKISRASREKQELDSLKVLMEKNASVTGMVSSLFALADRHNLLVSGINDRKRLGDNEFLYYFKFSGLYLNMVKFLRSVEREVVSPGIASVEITREEDRRTRESRLFLNLTLKKLDYEE